MAGNYNASVMIYKVDDAADLEWPLVARMDAYRPTARAVDVGSQLSWPLRGLLFRLLDNPVRTPTANDASVSILRATPGDVYAELREVVRLMGLTAHYSLAGADGGIELAPYTTPNTFRAWLTELCKDQRIRIFETFDNQIGVETYSDKDKATDMSTARLLRPRGGYRYTPRAEVDKEITVSQWPEGESFFRVTGNMVTQTDVRYAGSTTGFTRVTGGTDDPLPQGEVITR